MLSKKDIEIVGYLRSNAREKVTDIARTVKMPVTTIYDRIRAHERKGIVKQHVTLVDFSKLGYMTKALIAIKAMGSNRNMLQDYLETHPNINSLYRTGNCSDFIAEVVFENSLKLREFLDDTQTKFNATSQVFDVLNEIKKEVFLASKSEVA